MSFKSAPLKTYCHLKPSIVIIKKVGASEVFCDLPTKNDRRRKIRTISPFMAQCFPKGTLLCKRSIKQKLT